MTFRIYHHWDELTPTAARDVERILTEAFPPEERRSMDEVRRVLCGELLEMLTLEEGGNILGLLQVWNLEEMVFLEHFAIDKDRRGRGLGTKLLHYVWEYWGKPVILEVEPPEGETQRKRIAFYERNGFCLSDYPYLMPNLQGSGPALPLLLMSKPHSLTWSQARHCALRLYETAYREKERPEIPGQTPEKS